MYIHLNPLRAKLFKSLDKLDRYRWSCHGILMGKVKNEWQDCDYVLKWFGKKRRCCKKELSQLCQKRHRCRALAGACRWWINPIFIRWLVSNQSNAPIRGP